MAKNRFEPARDEVKPDDPPKLASLTYMPLPEDRDEVTVGGRVFRAYEPVELSEEEATRVAHLANNAWFSTGTIDAERKQKWEQLRQARRDIADRERDHAKAQADVAAIDRNVNVRPVEPGSVPFDPDRPAWAAPTNREATSDQIEADRVRREAERAARDREDIIAPLPGHDVWYWPAYNPALPQQAQPQAAKIAHVLHDRLVNLTVLNRDGQWFAARDVQLLQGDDVTPRNAYCEWPWEKGERGKEADEPKSRERYNPEAHDDPPHQAGPPDPGILDVSRI